MKRILATQGFGSGGNVSSSGETGVFQLIRSNAPVLFDVGGHVGEYSEAFLSAFPNGKSYIFEPSAPHVAALKKRLGDRAGVNIVNVGLGAELCRLPLYKDQEITGLASLSKRRLDHHGIALDRVEEVTISTLDVIVAETPVPSIDLLKIDVEGHELAVLRGAVKTLERGIIKLVQFEFGGTNLDSRTALQDFFYFFKDFGFKIGVAQPSGRVRFLKKYKELYELYLATNYVAAPI